MGARQPSCWHERVRPGNLRAAKVTARIEVEEVQEDEKGRGGGRRGRVRFELCGLRESPIAKIMRSRGQMRTRSAAAAVALTQPGATAKPRKCWPSA